MNPSRRATRREFLQGKLAGPLPPPTPELTAGAAAAILADSAETYLLRIGRRAMACEFEVLLNAGQYADGTAAALAALDLVEQLEDQLTVFREHSTVSRLNRAAADAAVEVEPWLFDLLDRAAQMHRRSGGAYDITSGPLSKIWGFFRRAGQLPDDAALADALSRVGCERMILDAQRRTVRFQTPGMEINLGSIGKGYALDRAAEALEARGVSDFLLHGGNSSLLARGSRLGGSPLTPGPSPARGEGREGGATAKEQGRESLQASTLNPQASPPKADKPQASGWWVGVRHPLRPGRRLGEVRLANRARGTSGSGAQFFFHAGRRYGHILDPRTGQPAEGMLSTTVLARTGAEADALSTAFYVLGRERALDYCQQHGSAHGGLAAILVSASEHPDGYDVDTFGLGDDWRPAVG